MKRLGLLTGLFAGIAACVSTGAHAQTYPNQPIRIVAPFPAGGLVDVLARAVGDEMAKSMGQPVIVENKPGAGGNIGAELVSKAAPDGYTLMMTSPGIQSINQFLYKTMPFDPDKAFTPISLVADMPMLVLVQPKTGIKSLKELVAAAKANPGKLNFGSAGVGTTGHLGQALLVHVGDMKVTHVPYKGAAPAVNDLLAGHIDGVVDNPPIVMAHIKAGTRHAARGGGQGAPVGAARCADLGRGRSAGLAGLVMVRADGAGRHAAGGGEAAECRSGESAEAALAADASSPNPAASWSAIRRRSSTR